MTSILDTLKAKAAEHDLAGKAERAARSAESYLDQGVKKAGQATHEHRDTVESWLDKAARFIDDKTDSKYSDKVSKARAQASKGVSKLAEQRPDGAATGTNPTDGTGTSPASTTATGTTAPGTTASGTTDTTPAGPSAPSAPSPVSDAGDAPSPFPTGGDDSAPRV